MISTVPTSRPPDVQRAPSRGNDGGTLSGETIGRLFLKAGQRWSPDRVVLRHKRYGIWNEYTWCEHFQCVKDFALGLMSLGLSSGDKIALIGDAEPQAYWALHAVWCVGAAIIALPVDAMDGEVQYMVDFADVRLAIAKDQEQVDKFLRIRAQLPKVERVVWWDPRGMHGYDDKWLTGFDAVSELGKAYAKDHPNAFEDRINDAKADDLATISYTSGTTGLSKAACRNHRSLLSLTESYQSLVHGTLDDDTVVSHAVGTLGETSFGSVAFLTHGVRVNIPEAPETYRRDLKEIGPTHLICGPLEWENIVSKIQVNTAEADFLKRTLFNQFLKIGSRFADLQHKGKRPHLFLRALHLLGELLVFHPVRDRVGLCRLKIAINTGYTLGEQSFRFLRALGIDIRQQYGSTEQGISAAHVDGQIRPQSVGVVLPGCELMVSPEGELLVRTSCSFNGYYKNPEATEKAKAGGWIHTGDSSYIDDLGHLYIFGRLSDVERLATGATYSPEFIEAQLRFGAHIHTAVAIGGRDRACVTAIVTLDQKAATRWAEKHHLLYTTLIDLSQNDAMAELVQKDIQRVNQTVPKEARIKKFVVLHKDLDADEGELTRTRKVKRKLVESRYVDMIDAMYADRTEVVVDAQVTYQDGRTGTVTAKVKVRLVPAQD